MSTSHYNQTQDAIKARIFQPAKNAMQSAHSNDLFWTLEFEHDGSRKIDPLMGWTSSSDMNQELVLRFNSLEEAIAYAEKNHISYDVSKPQKRKIIPKSYSDNFTS